MKENQKLTLTEKYFPTDWDQVYLPKKIKQEIDEQKQKVGYRLLLHSVPGTGKTTTARILTKDDDVLYLSGSNDFNIETLRKKVYPHASGHSILGKQKSIIIDESDGIRKALQEAFKIILDRARSCNFIFITNDYHEINHAIKSRCTEIEYDFVNEDLKEQKANFVNFAIKVCKAENIKYTKGGLKSIFKLNFPDFRHLLVHLQQIIDRGDDLTESVIKTMTDSGKQDIKLYSIIEDPTIINEDFYFHVQEYRGNELNAFVSLTEPFFQYLVDKKQFAKVIKAAPIVSKYGNEYLQTINKFTTFLSCMLELKTLFR